MEPLRISVGCGTSPITGWRNFDNSPSLRLVKHPLIYGALRSCGILGKGQIGFVESARTNPIEYGDVTKGLPIASGSVDVLYSSHMVEHLDREDAAAFLREARRVLRHGGLIRLAVPDIEIKVAQYMATKDADSFIESTYLAEPRPKTLTARMRFLIVGPRWHQWMYDGRSLSRFLESEGFVDATALKAGETRISNPGPLNLREREEDSAYVEARNP